MTTDPAIRYRRRRRWPVLMVIAVLLIATSAVWFQALKPEPTLGSGCNQPGPAPTTSAVTSRSRTASASSKPKTTAPPTSSVPTTLGVLTDKNVMRDIRPADPSIVQLRVFNASNVRGQAKTLGDELRTAGFESITKVDNDPLYPANDLRCVAEIRYGAAGIYAARTMLIVAPCAQLVVDDRADDSVDLAIGALFKYEGLSDALKAELRQIHEASIPPPVIEGQTLSAKPTPPRPELPQAVCPA